MKILMSLVWTCVGLGLCAAQLPVPSGFEPVAKVALLAAEERPLWRLLQERVGHERVQVAKAWTVATNGWGRVVDLPFRTSEGVSCHFGIIECGARRFPAYLTQESLPSSPGATLADAEAVLRARLFPGGVGKAKITFADHVLSADSAQVSASFERQRTVRIPFGKSWFFFVDDLPEAEWAHDARLVFVSEDLGALTVVHADMPAHLEENGQPVALKSNEKPDRKVKLQSTVLGADTKTAFPAETGCDSSHCYALILSGGGDKENNHCRYWREVCLVYNIMRKRFQLPKENVKVLWASGNPAADLCEHAECRANMPTSSLSDFDLDGSPDITGSTSVDDVKAAFKWYRENLAPSDQLLVFVTDHGGIYPQNGDYGAAAVVLWGGVPLPDTGLAEQTKDIKCPVVFALKTCYGGGMAPELVGSADNRVVVTSDDYDASMPYLWTHYLFSALCGFYPYGTLPAGFVDGALQGSAVDQRYCGGTCAGCDLDGDGHVSFYEAHAFAVAMNRYTAANGCSGDEIDKPSYFESPTSPGIGKKLFLTKYLDGPGVVVREKVAAPVFETASGQFAPYAVTVSCSESGATIRYTLDGSDPIESSTVYRSDAGIEITRDVVVKARAFKSGKDGSETASRTYEVRKTPPEAATIMSVSQNDSSTAIVIKWLGGDGTAAFEILRAENSSMSGARAIATGLAPTVSEYADVSAAPGVSYYYQIRSRNDYGATSSMVSNPALRSLMPPGGISVTPSGSGSTAYATIEWKAVQGGTYYRVWRRIGSGTPEPVSSWQTGYSFLDTIPRTKEKIAYAVSASASSAGANASALSAFSEIDYPEELLDWKLSFYGENAYRSTIYPLQLFPGESATVTCRFVYSDGTEDRQNFVSGVQWSIRQTSSRANCVGHDGSYRETGSIKSYSAPTATINASSGDYEEKIEICATYTFRGVTRTFSYPMVLSRRKIVSGVHFSAFDNYMFPGEKIQLACGPDYLESNAPGNADLGESSMSVVEGGGVTLDASGELTALDIPYKTNATLQATYVNADGTFTATTKVYVVPHNVRNIDYEIPAEGGSGFQVDIGMVVGRVKVLRSEGDEWVSSMSLTVGSSSLDLKGWSGNVSVGDITGRSLSGRVSFGAKRNGGEDRGVQIVLRGHEDIVYVNITQQSAERAKTPSISVDGLSVGLSCETDDVQLRYALDGEEPGSASGLLLGDSLELPEGSTAIAVKAFGEWVRESDTSYASIDDGEVAEEIEFDFDPVEEIDVDLEARVYALGDTFGELPVLTHPTLYFKGWALEPGSNQKVRPGDSVPVEGGTLYAIWSRIAEDEPEWTVLPWEFSKHMNMTVVVSNAWTGQLEDCTACRVGVLDATGACRGFSGNGSEEQGLARLGQAKSWPFSFGVHGGQSSESGLAFSVWKDDVGYLNVLNPSVVFDADSAQGTAGAPYVVVVGPKAGGALAFGPGEGSLFAWKSDLGGGIAKLVGVSGLVESNFATCSLNGEGTRSGLGTACCFEDGRIVDAEKNAVQDDADDYWCPALVQLNLAYWGGWISADEFSTVDAAADYLRASPMILCDYSTGEGDGCYGQEGVFDWILSDTLRRTSGCDMDDHLSWCGDGQSVASFLEESFKGQDRLVGMMVEFPDYSWKGSTGVGHMVVCCGLVCDMSKSVDDQDYLKGLFVIDSDNDMLTGSGGAAAPNRIAFCPVEWDADAEQYAISGVFGTRGYLDPDSLYALQSIRPLENKPFQFLYEVEGSDRRLVGIDGICPEEIAIEDGVTEIGSLMGESGSAAKLRKVTIPPSVTYVASDAFSCCHKLETVEIHSENVTIDSMAFYGGRIDWNSPDEVSYELFPDLGLKSVTASVSGKKFVGWNVVAREDADASKNGFYPVSVSAILPVVGQLVVHSSPSGPVVSWCSYEVTPVFEKVEAPVVPDTPVTPVVPVDPAKDPGVSVASPIELVEPTGDFSPAGAMLSDGAIVLDGVVQGVIQVKIGKVSKKNESKVSVSIFDIDGRKFSSKAVSVRVGGQPTVSFEVKKYGTVTLTFGANGYRGKVNGTDITSLSGMPVTAVGGATFTESDLSTLSGVLREYFPIDEAVDRTAKKWKVAAKPGKLKYVKANPRKGVAEGLLATGSNIAGLKLSYAPKTQTFKGSFKIWTFDEANKKLKSVSAKVTGVVVNGTGHGVATVKKAKVGDVAVK